MANLGTPTRFRTTWVILVCAIVLIAWDIYAAMSPTEPTISALTLGLSAKTRIIPFGLGVLMGHLCWPQVVKEAS